MNHSEPVTATPCAQETDMWNDPPAGSFWFNESGSYILCLCPCGCGQFMNLPINSPNKWTWNLNRDKPTITPSIRDLGGCRFHGYLTDGVWTFCADSGKQ
jgi:hypothetical protein